MIPNPAVRFSAIPVMRVPLLADQPGGKQTLRVGKVWEYAPKEDLTPLETTLKQWQTDSGNQSPHIIDQVLDHFRLIKAKEMKGTVFTLTQGPKDKQELLGVAVLDTNINWLYALQTKPATSFHAATRQLHGVGRGMMYAMMKYLDSARLLKQLKLAPGESSEAFYRKIFAGIPGVKYHKEPGTGEINEIEVPVAPLRKFIENVRRRPEYRELAQLVKARRRKADDTE
jgi:hypothetical protein